MRRYIAVLAVTACTLQHPDPRPPVDPGPSGDPDWSDPIGVDSGPPDPPNFGVRPKFGPTVTLTDPPPPISGGTLAVSPDGKIAVAADPDRDLVYVIDPSVPKVLATIGLAPHDEPGRVAIDGSNRAHVALRRAGALLTIDLATFASTRRDVCGAPRGVAWDPASDSVHVACGGGELVTFSAAGGPATRAVTIERDLRDVLVSGTTLMVTTFRTAKLITLDTQGKLTSTIKPKGKLVSGAWRTIVQDNGDVWMLHQVSSGFLAAQQDAYNGAVVPVVTTFRNGAPIGQIVLCTALSTDLALEFDSIKKTAFPVVPIPGNGHTDQLDKFFWKGSVVQNGGGGGPPPTAPTVDLDGYQFTSSATTADRILFLAREPARLVAYKTDHSFVGQATLSDVSREDTGHAVFHANSSANLTCASCHLEGADDGIVWTIDQQKRRTPSLRGTIAGTAPYHWEGDQHDIAALLGDVYTKRMSGGPLEADQKDAVRTWVSSIPAPPKLPGDAAAASRGQALFQGAGGCTACHQGVALTDNTNHAVGNSAMFQTPSLVGVGWRAPFLHDGCATTLRDRFNPTCRANAHGSTAMFGEAQLGDLVAYLDSL